MASYIYMKTCGVCNSSISKGRAMLTLECSHSFHFSCFNDYAARRNCLCPVCRVSWSHRLPLVAPPPTRFDDDEPLPDPTSVDSLDSQHVTIRAVPEHTALAAARSASLFSVLVSLKAPPLSDGARSDERAPVDIVAVLDISGSMYGKKLALVKRAVCFVIDNLGVSDRLSVVSFSDRATRVLPLRRMTDSGREVAKQVLSSLVAHGSTNILDGLRKGSQVLEERQHKNPVSSIIFLSDGNDTCSLDSSEFSKSGDIDGSRLVSPSVPVHTFGFGSDHDPITMHAISDASGGNFSFIESIEMVQDAFAGCIGGLLSVLTQELHLKLRSASHGVEIKSIDSGRYRSEITNQGSEGVINVGDLYADEEREFLINLSVPKSTNVEAKTSLLDITCSYRDVVSKQTVLIETELVEILRPEFPSPQDSAVNLEVDRQRNRFLAAGCIQQAQEMAEAGNLEGARNLLVEKRSYLMATAAAVAGDGMTKWLEGEMKETEIRFGSSNMYKQSGRAYALCGMSAHASQRAVFGAAGCELASGSAGPGYATPQMANMVAKSQQQKSKAGEENDI